MWQLLQSMSGIQRIVQILWKNRTLEEICSFAFSAKLLPVSNRPKEEGKQGGDTKSDGKQHRDAGKGSRRRDRRFHDLEPAASFPSEKTPLSPMTAYAYPAYAARFSQHWMLLALGKRAYARSNSRWTLELRGTHSPLGHTSRCTRHSPSGHTSRCTRHSPQKTSLSPQGTSSWLPTTLRRFPV